MSNRDDKPHSHASDDDAPESPSQPHSHSPLSDSKQNDEHTSTNSNSRPTVDDDSRQPSRTDDDSKANDADVVDDAEDDSIRFNGTEAQGDDDDNDVANPQTSNFSRDALSDEDDADTDEPSDADNALLHVSHIGIGSVPRQSADDEGPKSSRSQRDTQESKESIDADGGGGGGGGDGPVDDLFLPIDESIESGPVDSVVDTSDADALPAFASDANKALDAAVRAKQRLLAKQIDAVEECRTRTALMRQHLRHVEAEHEHAQQLVRVKKQDTQQEAHLVQLATREAGRVESDAAAVGRHVALSRDELNALHNALYASNEKLSQFRTQMNWNQEELLQWSLASKQKDEDAQLVARYASADGRQIAKLTLRKENVQRVVLARKETLSGLLTQTRQTQTELDQTSSAYRRAHQARNEAIRQWDSVCRDVYESDRVLLQKSEEIFDARAQCKTAEDAVNEAKRQETVMKNDAKLTELAISALERQLVEVKSHSTTNRDALQTHEDQVATIRGQLEKTEGELKNLQNRLQKGQDDLHRRQNVCEQLNQEIDALKEQLNEQQNMTEERREKSESLDDMHRQQTAALASAIKAVDTLKQQVFTSISAALPGPGTGD